METFQELSRELREEERERETEEGRESVCECLVLHIYQITDTPARYTPKIHIQNA